ncbi:MAG: Lrp/AsnC family transcriptional regulator [Rhodocyclaceae bacterium]|nr:Lrp/AsnC family transcriptional regulator [Rhodocyclaceae bacterium]
MDALDLRLCSEFERDFPVVARPFAEIGARLGESETLTRARFGNLLQSGRIARIGAVFAPHAFGASTLAAFAVAPDLLHATAAVVNACAEVSHTCTRDHHYNLWCVATASDAAALARRLQRLQEDIGCQALSVPVEEEYYLEAGGAAPRAWDARDNSRAIGPQQGQRRLAELLRAGLDLVPHPYVRLGMRAGGLRQEEVMDLIRAWRAGGLIKRYGVIGRAGADTDRVNALCLWDVPDAAMPALGLALAAEPAVALCYRRARVDAAWPYNLYCVMRAPARADVEAAVGHLVQAHGLAGYPHEVLFARRRYAPQQGAGRRFNCA